MKVFTTGQVAKICKVAPRTVSKWFDSGRLKGYRIPGSQDRRIPREYLIKFLKEHGMPLGDLEDEAMAKVLIVAQDQVLIENLKRELPVERSFRTSTAASGFEAGIQAESFHPDCIIVDFSIGQLEALQICQNLRRNAEFGETILIALLPDDSSTANFDRSSINETFKKPFDAALLAERLANADRREEGIGLTSREQGAGSTESEFLLHAPCSKLHAFNIRVGRTIRPRGGGELPSSPSPHPHKRPGCLRATGPCFLHHAAILHCLTHPMLRVESMTRRAGTCRAQFLALTRPSASPNRLSPPKSWTLSRGFGRICDWLKAFGQARATWPRSSVVRLNWTRGQFKQSRGMWFVIQYDHG